MSQPFAGAFRRLAIALSIAQPKLTPQNRIPSAPPSPESGHRCADGYEHVYMDHRSSSGWVRCMFCSHCVIRQQAKQEAA